MIISSINTNLKYSNKTHNIKFQAHPDFDKLAKISNITASSYFRRGPVYGAPSELYKEIVTLFENIFKTKKDLPQKMLIVGIGNSQEPFSYLATIQDIIKDEKLESVLDLHTVDLQSKPTTQKLFYDSYYQYKFPPEYATSSFIPNKNIFQPTNIKDLSPDYRLPTALSLVGLNDKQAELLNTNYRVNNDIFDYLHSTYENPQKSQWETRIQDASEQYKDNNFDIISINNTLYYISNPIERENTIDNIYRILKKGGILISDPYYGENEGFNSSNLFKKIGFGIYEKK